jgi:hypothetical protein
VSTFPSPFLVRVKKIKYFDERDSKSIRFCFYSYYIVDILSVSDKEFLICRFSFYFIQIQFTVTINFSISSRNFIVRSLFFDWQTCKQKNQWKMENYLNLFCFYVTRKSSENLKFCHDTWWFWVKHCDTLLE